MTGKCLVESERIGVLHRELSSRHVQSGLGANQMLRNDLRWIEHFQNPSTCENRIQAGLIYSNCDGHYY